jgi:hypothetical protein
MIESSAAVATIAPSWLKMSCPLSKLPGDVWLIVTPVVFVIPEAGDRVGTATGVVFGETVVVSTPSANNGALAATRYVEVPSAGVAEFNETADPEKVA